MTDQLHAFERDIRRPSVVPYESIAEHVFNGRREVNEPGTRARHAYAAALVQLYRRCLYETLSLKSATLPTRRMLAHVPL